MSLISSHIQSTMQLAFFQTALCAKPASNTNSAYCRTEIFRNVHVHFVVTS